jgi:uncharacterized membrane protein
MNIWKRWLLYGALGWVIEIIFTGVGSALLRDWNLTGHTYLWMFPIYATAALALEVMYDNLRDIQWLWRGLVYTGFIFAVEYLSGWLLMQLLGVCPWEYPAASPNIDGLIRLDFAPAWMAVAFAFEWVYDYLAPLPQWIRLRKAK